MKKLAEAQKDQHAVIALNNVTVIDRYFSKLNNDFGSYLQILDKQFQGPPLFATDIAFRVPTADEIILFGNGITANDLIVPIIFNTPVDQNVGTNMTLGITAFYIRENYMNFKQGVAHDLMIYNYASFTGPVIFNKMSRNIHVEPSGGANSISEFFVLPVKPSSYLSQQTPAIVNGLTTQAFQTATDAKGNMMNAYLYQPQVAVPYPGLDLLAGSVLVLKNMASTGGNFTALPVYGHMRAARVLQEVFNS